MGTVIAFPLLLIGIVFVLFENGLRVLRSWVERGCQHLLRKPPYMKEDEFSEARYVIACLVFLVLTVGALYGESVNLQFILPQSYETSGGATGASVEQASLWLYLFVPVFLFALWFEFRDRPIFGLRLFPNIDNKTKKWLGMLILVGLILACVVFVGIWHYRALAIVYPETLAGIRIILFALMGMVASVTLGFAVVGLKVGLIGFGVVVLDGLWVIASVLLLVLRERSS